MYSGKIAVPPGGGGKYINEKFQGGKIEKVSTRQFGPWTKSLNGGRCHIFDKGKVNNLKLSSTLT
jgi:hypothetical protein